MPQMWKYRALHQNIAQYGKMKRARETRRFESKGNFNKTEFRKAMITAWGESESDANTKNPEEEETTNLCLMASHESKDEKSKGKQVKSSNSFLTIRLN